MNGYRALIVCIIIFPLHAKDLSVIGFINIDDGIGKHAVMMLDMYKNTDIRVTWESSRDCGFNLGMRADDPKLNAIIQSNDREPATVALFVDQLWDRLFDHSARLPSQSLIKIAFSVIESTQIPVEWVDILNTKFDLVVVPDPFLVNVYRSSGVRKPIAVLPFTPYLEPLLEMEPRPARINPEPFVFGNLSGAFPHKNIDLLIKSFAHTFGNNPAVQLKINSRFGTPELIEELQNLVASLGVSNIEFNVEMLSWQKYIEFLKSIDCYVSFAGGEGFSMIPREAMALAVPLMITDNSAQQTICASGCIKAVPCTICKPAFFPWLDRYCGEFCEPSFDDAVSAFRDFYDHYDEYQSHAQLAKAWVKQYTFDHLRKKYISLIKPQRVILGTHTELGDDYLMTESKELFDKYVQLGAQK